MVRQSAAFSPCNITGFFRIHDRTANPLKIGSTGAGVALDQGVTTRLRIRKALRSKVFVTFNGKALNNPIVSRNVAETYLGLDGGAWELRIFHECGVPVGCGYGTSGAGALGLSLALNEAMGLSFTQLQSAQIAHECEVKCKTGLGTVASVFSGGFTVRTQPGAPGIGVVEKIRLSPSLRVVSASFGPVSTRRVLSSQRLKTRINFCGRTLISKILRETTDTMFMSLSGRFANCLGLMSNRLTWVTKMLQANCISSSMMMLGESLFCILPVEEVPLAKATMHDAGLIPSVCKVAKSGATLI